MSNLTEPFHIYSVEKWEELKPAYQSDWPRGITGYYALDELAKYINAGLDYGFKVLVPFGDPKNGMVMILKDENNTEDNFIEVLMECPQDNTSKLEEALKTTSLIDWSRHVVVLFLPKHVLQCLKRIEKDQVAKIQWEHNVEEYVLDKNTPLMDVSLPPEFTIKPLTEEYTGQVELTWPHRYPGSIKYFTILIKCGSGYGLFKSDQLVAWGFVKETGALGHLYTVEDHRRKGYGELITKFICNERLKEGKDVFSFLVAGNIESSKMHEKIGFVKVSNVFSAGVKSVKAAE